MWIEATKVKNVCGRYVQLQALEVWIFCVTLGLFLLLVLNEVTMKNGALSLNLFLSPLSNKIATLWTQNTPNLVTSGNQEHTTTKDMEWRSLMCAPPRALSHSIMPLSTE